MSKKDLIPELRFPEFKNEGEWELTSIGKIGNFYYGKSAPKWSLSEDASTPCVRYGELYTKFDTVISEIKSRTNIEPSDLKFSKGGEILVPRVGERATDFAKNCCYLPFSNIAIGEMISVFETKEFPIFYTHYFRTLWREFAEVVEGQNVKNLYYINLEPIKIGKPSYPEQQKIASCLSSLDEVIIAYSKMLDLLKDHKKGLMQNLFPQEGETVPKWRFKEFSESWKKVKLKDVSIYFNGGSYENEVKEEGRYELITLKSINTNGSLVNSKRYIDIEVPTLTKGTLVMILSEQAPGLLGMTAIIPTNNKYVLNQRVAEIRPNKKVESYFLSMAINRNQNYFSKQGAGTKVQNISKPNVENYEFLLPEILEQQKIASCLSSLDALITAQVEKIEQLKLHKKGLMQGLFPKIKE